MILRTVITEGDVRRLFAKDRFVQSKTFARGVKCLFFRTRKERSKNQRLFFFRITNRRFVRAAESQKLPF